MSACIYKKNHVSYRTLERLLGFLSFCTRVLPLGRPFLRNLFTFLRRLSHIHPQALARINAPAKRELLWWSSFLPRWSGIQLISAVPRAHVHVYTDASSTQWRNCQVEVHCDNWTIVSAINSRTIRGPAIDLLQALFLTSTLDNIDIRPTWLSSQDNWIADALSRFEFSKITNIFPQFLDPCHHHRHSGNPISAF